VPQANRPDSEYQAMGRPLPGPAVGLYQPPVAFRQIKAPVSIGQAAIGAFYDGDARAGRKFIEHVFDLAQMAAASSRGGDMSCLLSLAKSALKSGHWDAADAIFEEIIELHRDHLLAP